MWNSDSRISWLLVSSGHDVTGINPPGNGRTPGWRAGLTVAAGHPPLQPGRTGIAITLREARH
jgi:hypothetical protein